jgi:pimeloyl-ACP methyl ester carboxylesterase
MKDSEIQLPDGRRLAYTDIGEPGWPCMLFFHGAPSSRLRLTYLEDEIAAAGIRVISPDRPSYGGSSPQPGRSLTDWPGYVAALMGALDIDRFGVAGHSSGGPYAVAVAALLPDRVSGLVTFGGVTDMGWPGAAEGYFETELALMRMPDEASVFRWCEQHFGEDGSGFMTASGMELPEADLPLYADERIASLLTVARAEAFRQGVGGYAQDVFIQGRPWSFAPSQIRAQGIILHGEGDTLLPLGHSRHTASVVSGARLDVLPDHGHFSILGELPGIAAVLLA